ncbi:hypothetical protein Cni_G20181 [Canna indica]|uniref:Uncharacterized protein n=1 Tax=Canna indica TaxID=4628 RepID=A0AAQ3KND7_9LILI|nr:hypothetical protein Cni_G20181 [Canna indica]
MAVEDGAQPHGEEEVEEKEEEARCSAIWGGRGGGEEGGGEEEEVHCAGGDHGCGGWCSAIGEKKKKKLKKREKEQVFLLETLSNYLNACPGYLDTISKKIALGVLQLMEEAYAVYNVDIQSKSGVTNGATVTDVLEYFILRDLYMFLETSLFTIIRDRESC